MNKLEKDLNTIFDKGIFDDATVSKFKKKIKEGKLTIQEDDEHHLCVYFAAYDPLAKEVFIGHHKKSGLWLFNGGHIDKGEIPMETIEREIGEEWGLDAKDLDIKTPELLTITNIIKNKVRPCATHYDIWYYISVNKMEFLPKKECLNDEFYETGWKDYKTAIGLMREKNTIKSLEFIKDNLFF